MSDTLHFKVSGMSCGGCSSRLEKSLMEIPGITAVQASHDTGVVDVTLADTPVAVDGLSRDAVRTAIEETGFDVVEEPIATRQ